MKDLTIALVQPDLHWEQIETNLTILSDKIDSIESQPDIIILPETFSTGFSMNTSLAEPMDGLAMRWLQVKAAERKCVITGSLILYTGDGADRKYYNRLIWMRPDGSYEHYDKRHLFSLSDEPKTYTRGQERLVVTHMGWKICPMICYDLRFPVWARNGVDDQRNADYDLLVYVANWPEKRSLAWKTLLPARAVENLAYVAGVNRVGIDNTDINCIGESMVLDPVGNKLYQAPQTEDVAVITLSAEELIKNRRLYPFLRDADHFRLV